MSVELENLSREELEDLASELRDRNDRLDTEISELRQDVGGLQLIVRELLGVEADDYDHIHELQGDAASIRRDLDSQRRLITKVSKQLESVGDLTSEQSTKTEKIAAIRQYAENVADGEDVVELSCQDIVAATGVSRRYAYDLMDPDTGLPSEHEWVEFKPADERVVGSPPNQVKKHSPKAIRVDTRAAGGGGS